MDVLGLTVDVVALRPQLPADPGLLVAPERPLGVDQVVVVDPHRSGAHPGGNGLGTLQIPRLHTAGQSVDRVVGDGDGLVVGGERDHAQHRAENLLLGDAGRVGHAGEDGGPVEAVGIEPVGEIGGLVTSNERLAHLFTTERHVALHGLDLTGVDQRAEVRGHVQRVAQGDLGGAFDQQVDELVVDGGVHQRPGARLAHLATMHERAPQHTGGGLVQIGIVEHDVGRLATQFQGHRLHRARGQLHDAATHLGGTGERRLVDHRVAGQFLAHGATGTGDHVEHTGGQDVGVVDELGQTQGAERRERCRLEHRGVAGRQCRSDLPRRHDEREVPRHDAGAHTKRLEQHVVGRHRERRTLEVGAVGAGLGHLGEPLKSALGTGNVGHHGLADGATAVTGLDLRQLGGVVGDQLGDLTELGATLGTRHLRPGTFIESATGGGNGTFGVLAVTLGHIGDLLAGGRVIGGESLARRRVAQFTVDEHLVISHDIPLGPRSASRHRCRPTEPSASMTRPTTVAGGRRGCPVQAPTTDHLPVSVRPSTLPSPASLSRWA